MLYVGVHKGGGKRTWCGSEKKGDDNDKGEQLHVGLWRKEKNKQ